LRQAPDHRQHQLGEALQRFSEELQKRLEEGLAYYAELERQEREQAG
jgi:hypothetical protein